MNPKETQQKIAELEEQIELLQRVLGNTIHEIEILKQALFQQGSLTPSQWNKSFFCQKEKFLSKPKGSTLKLLKRYEYDLEKWIHEIFPNTSTEEKVRIKTLLQEKIHFFQ